MVDLNSLCELEMDRVLEILEKAIEKPLSRVHLDRSSSYVKNEDVSTIKTHRIHDDSYVTVRVSHV